ncbi:MULTISPECIES: DUF6320 domain-containing protein [unclassified Butyrivibrio]|uniref:DUF6320 domain-containing protein n=1 Tax=unclassified Butyrivibrio TaxID=2639466 RepID=UPI0003B58B3B|nr:MULTISPECIES: DUF6320 domain-containing protein [unclassified Butyrivibrio]MDC7294030.1 DUF6320 domain-containing protein [Butyrivibrio sp. DSM 10294]
MQYCPKCKVNIRGNKRCCPLCQGQLKDSELQMEPPFPRIKMNKVSNITFMKMCTFLFIALEIIFETINIMTHREHSFIGVVMLGLVAGWVTIITTLYLRNNLLKVITWEVFVAIVVDIYIDMKTGFLGWSLVWMVPGTLIGLAIATIIIAKVLKLRLDEYALYIVFDILMSLIQIIFIRNGMNKFPWPAGISIMIYLILGVAMVIFRFRDLKNASQKMFNM